MRSVEELKDWKGNINICMDALDEARHQIYKRRYPYKPALALLKIIEENEIRASYYKEGSTFYEPNYEKWKEATEILIGEEYTVNQITEMKEAFQKELTSVAKAERLNLGGDVGSQAVKNALARLGKPYSQAKRDSGDYYDRSSLTYYSYKEAGITLSYHGSNTTASQGQLLSDRGCEVDYEDIQQGDLIFYSFTRNGRYKNISHVAIYAGNGYLVDASSSKGYEWRDKGRYVRRGSKGIAIIDSSHYRPYVDHVFDISDTNGRERPEIWRLDKDGCRIDTNIDFVKQ